VRRALRAAAGRTDIVSLWSRIRNTVRGDRHRADILEELEFHLEMDAVEGHDRRQTRLRLGNVARIHEEARAVGIIEWVDSTLRDARHGLRQLLRTPALTVAVVLSLAIGLGANAAIFSLVDAAILRPLPVKDPDRLVIAQWTNDDFPPDVENHNGEFTQIAGGRRQGSSISASLYRRLAREQTGFDALIGIGAYPDAVAITVDTLAAQQVSLQYVSGNFFQGVGVLPMLGRPFHDEEDRVGGEPVVIVSHRFWVSRLGSGRDALERQIRINNIPARIVGVAPPGFFGLRTGQWPDVYAPLAMKVAFQGSTAAAALRAENDRNWWVRAIGRLRPGVSETAARTELGGLFRSFVVPEGTTIEPTKIPELITMPGQRGFGALNAREADALWILMVLVGVVLLVVCANVANLLLSRAVSRQKESAVRLALGAGRMRLFRQHLIESGVVALMGGGAGIALGYALARSIHRLFQSGRDAGYAYDLHLDVRVLAYTSALSILAALLFGLAPAVRAARADLGDMLKSHTRSIAGGRLRLPRMLVSIQIALCLAALVAAGLLGRSLENLRWMDVGFDRENLAYVSVSPAQAGYTVERLGPYLDRVRDALAGIPGVLHVSPVATRLLAGGGNNGRVTVPGRPWDDATRANLNRVGDGFFETMRIPLVAGRAIERRDMRPDAGTVVVDELFARKYFPNVNPLGRHIGLDPKDDYRYEIVGIVRDSRYNNLRSDAVPTVYEPYRPAGTMHFAIRTTMDTARLHEAARRAVAAVDPAVPVTEFRTQTALIDRLLRTERLLGFVSGAFGLVALTLAAIGLGGLLAYAVARRRNEIGLRMALGAAAADVIRMVLRDSMRMVGAGILIGLPCAYVIARLLRTALFQLEPLDLRTAAFSIVVLLGVALVSAWVPARRAATIDPVLALREE
jgi:predicted permease